MGHAVSREVISNSSGHLSSQTLSADSTTEPFTIVKTETGDMNDKSKTKGKKPVDVKLGKTFSVEVQTERELLEKEHPELKQVFLGFQHCKTELERRDKENDRYFGEINKLLMGKVIAKFTMAEFSDDEQREVMGNKLAEIG